MHNAEMKNARTPNCTGGHVLRAERGLASAICTCNLRTPLGQNRGCPHTIAVACLDIFDRCRTPAARRGMPAWTCVRQLHPWPGSLGCRRRGMVLWINDAKTPLYLCRTGAREGPEHPRPKHLTGPMRGTQHIPAGSVVSFSQFGGPYCGTLEAATVLQAESLRESPTGGPLKKSWVRYGF